MTLLEHATRDGILARPGETTRCDCGGTRTLQIVGGHRHWHCPKCCTAAARCHERQAARTARMKGKII